MVEDPRRRCLHSGTRLTQLDCQGFQFLVKDPRRRSLLQEEDLPASTTRDDAQNHTRQPYLQASGGGRPTKVLSTHQFESRGSSDRQSAKVDIAKTMLSMAGVSRPGTAQSAQPTAIQRSPFSPYQVGLARPVPSSLHRESCEPRVHDSHARVYFPRAFATGRGRSVNESELFSC